LAEGSLGQVTPPPPPKKKERKNKKKERKENKTKRVLPDPVLMAG